MDRAEMEAKFVANEALALYFVGRHQYYSKLIGFDDAVQLARIALWQAIERHDPSRASLGTWAGWVIRGALSNAAKRILRQRAVTIDAASLDAPLGADNALTLGDVIGADDHRLEASAIDVEELLARLSPEEAAVIGLRWGFAPGVGDEDDGRNLNGVARGGVRTLAEVGELLGGVSRQRIQQIEAQAQMRMRGELRPFTWRGHRPQIVAKALGVERPGRPWMWTSEAAQVLGINARRTKNLCRRLGVPNVNGRYRIGPADLARLQAALVAA